jgi:hypothetical protein
MARARRGWVRLAVGALAGSGALSCGPAPRSGAEAGAEPGTPPAGGQAEADLIRATERERLRALVAADVPAARRLHADDFQLINPAGGALTKDQYLEAVASGQVDYIYWEPDSIAVRAYGRAAVIRYQSQLEVVFQGQPLPRRRFWHTDAYEKRDGNWQVVWSQATEVR